MWQTLIRPATSTIVYMEIKLSETTFLFVIAGLTFMSEILCRMWRFICELGPSGGLELFLSSLSLPPDVSEPYFAVFTLFCDMTSHIIS